MALGLVSLAREEGIQEKVMEKFNELYKIFTEEVSSLFLKKQQ
jgi:hypothetical protein